MFVLLLFICYLAFCLCFKNAQIIEAYILHVYDNVFLFKLFRGDILLLNICSSHINNQSLIYILTIIFFKTDIFNDAQNNS